MASLGTKPNGQKYPGFSQEKEGKWTGSFLFIQGADTQFGLKDSWNKVPEENQKWNDEIELTRVAIKAANALRPRPRFFVVCGDMIDAFPGRRNYEAQFDDFKAVFQELDPEIPLVCVCGNHDIGDQPTVESIAKYRNNYGDDYFSFWVGGVLFIVINSQYYKDGTLVQEVKKEHDSWLDEQLKHARTAKHTVVFQHIPLFLKSMDEDDDYFNFPKNDRENIREKLKSAGVKHVFAGHYHRNAGGFDGDLEMVVTSAIGFPLGKDKPGMRLVTVKEDRITHSFQDLDSFPKTVELK